MKIPGLQKLVNRARSALRREDDSFLKDARGVIHVGANAGQERDRYRKHGVRVAWVEPIPEVFDKLETNLQGYPNQRAFRYLVTDQDDVPYTFHVASNNGASSSILQMKLHQDIWPEVRYEKSIELTSVTLPTMLAREGLSISDYDALVMDTQGSELLILQGAEALLSHIRYVKTEAPDFESYAGCCLISELSAFLAKHGFTEQWRNQFAEHADGGGYYDVLFARL